MADLAPPARDSVAAQQELFRRAAKKGFTLNVLHAANSYLRVNTMRGWASGETAMPAWAIGALGEAGIPDHLLSLVTQPFGRCVVTEEEGEGDLDDAASAATEFAGLVLAARNPKSPGGVSIVPQEAINIHHSRERAISSMRRARA